MKEIKKKTNIENDLKNNVVPFRLIKGGQTKEKKQEPPVTRQHGKNNSFVKFMDSYADALEKEVQVLLDL